MIEVRDLSWRKADGSRILYLRQKASVEVIPDKTYPNMWRVQLPDGTVSDMANLVWAKDAAVSIALGTLNPKKKAEKRPQRGPAQPLKCQGVPRQLQQAVMPTRANLVELARPCVRPKCPGKKTVLNLRKRNLAEDFSKSGRWYLNRKPE